MQIVYGFIYFFTIFMTCCVAALAVFLLPRAREIFAKTWRKYEEMLNHDGVRYAMMLIFAIIGLVFIESIYTYSILHKHFSHKSARMMMELGGLDNIDLVFPKTHNREGYLVALKEYRQFYLAERNIMLVVSALFTFFVFRRMLHNVRKYAELEQAIRQNKGSISEPVQIADRAEGGHSKKE